MRQGGPLGHRGERYQGEGNADGDAGQDGEDYPSVVHHDRLNPRGDHRYGHGRYAGEDSPPGGLGIVHPVQREDEQRGRYDVGELYQRAHGCCFSSRPVLNILSIRSVIRKPLTMLVMEANRAMVPRSRVLGGWSDPVTMIDPTTAMAEM